MSMTAEARLAQLLADMRTIAIVAGQSSVETCDPIEEKLALLATTWADELEAVLSRWRSAHAVQPEPADDGAD